VHPKEVFLSHSSSDRTFVSRLADVIGRHGVPYWYSRTNILGAQQWHDQIGHALERCDWFTVILSPRSVESLWVKRELLFALQQNRFENKILPVLLELCDHNKLSWTLSLFQVVDFSEEFDRGCRDMLRMWGMGYQP
jgi:hypothetical protein